MSKNFYWAHEPIVLPSGDELPVDEDSPIVHIGKAAGGRFAWAQDPGRVRGILAGRPEERLVVDEVGRVYARDEFEEYLGGLTEDMSMVGRAFN